MAVPVGNVVAIVVVLVTSIVGLIIWWRSIKSRRLLRQIKSAPSRLIEVGQTVLICAPLLHRLPFG